LGDTEEQRTAGGRLAALADHALVLLAEAELIHLLLEQEGGIAHVLDLHPAHHLTHDDLDVLVGDVDALQAIDLLDLVDQVGLQFLLSEDGEDIVRVERAIHERLAGAYALAFLHVDVHATRDGVLLLRSRVGGDVDLAHALADLAEADDAIDLADDRGLTRLAGLEELDHTRQTAGDVLGRGGLARDLGEDVARMDLVSVVDHQVGAAGHEVTLGALGALDADGGLALLVGRIADDVARQSGDLVDLLVQREAFLQVLELDGA